METRKPADVKKSRFGPERSFFRSLVGKRVTLVFHRDGGVMFGKIVWVDRFTLCLRDENTGKDKMVYKHALEQVFEA